MEQTVAYALRQARNDALDSAADLCDALSTIGKNAADCATAIRTFKKSLRQPNDPLP
jgi:hypothetical protein